MSTRLKELREKQSVLVIEARSRLDEITATTPEGRAAELEAQHDAAMAEYDRLEERAKREERLVGREAAQRTADDRRPNQEDRSGQAGGEVERNVDLKAAFVRGMQFGVDAIEDPVERRAVAALRTQMTPEMRAQAASTPAAGGYTVPQGFLPELMKAMADWGPMLDPAVTRVIDTDTGNALPWPTADDTANVGALLSENAQATEQDITFGVGQIDAWTYTSKIIRVSLQLLQDSAFDMDSLINELFGERIARAANTDLTVGNNASRPNGIVTAAPMGKTAASATVITSDEVIDFYHSVNPAYRRSPKFGMMFNDNTLKVLRKLKDGQGNYLLESLKDGGATLNLAGISVPYTINQAVADIATGARVMVAGDFNKYIVRRVKDFTLMRLVERYADYLQVGFVAFNRIDGELADAAAVKHFRMA